MNNVSLIGRPTKAPEIRYTAVGAPRWCLAPKLSKFNEKGQDRDRKGQEFLKLTLPKNLNIQALSLYKGQEGTCLYIKYIQKNKKKKKKKKEEKKLTLVDPASAGAWHQTYQLMASKLSSYRVPLY